MESPARAVIALSQNEAYIRRTECKMCTKKARSTLERALFADGYAAIIAE